MSDAHNHQHDVPAEQGDLTGLDPANRALSDALRVSFAVLKLVIVCVFGLFIYSGAFVVEQNEQAVVLRFGKITGTGLRAVKQPGWHWAWPALDEIVKIPSANAIRQLDVETFWYHLSEQEKLTQTARPPGKTLQFVRDGYSLTASRPAETASYAARSADSADASGLTAVSTDYNLAHTRWVIRYSISDPLALFGQIWNGSAQGWTAVEKFLQNALADAVIVVSANRDIEDILWNEPLKFKADIERAVVARIRDLDVGLDVELELIDNKPPRQVKAAFDSAFKANLNKRSVRAAAEANRNQIVSDAQANANLIVAEARTYRHRIIQSAKADAKYLDEILGKIEKTARQRVPDGTANIQAVRRKVYDELLAVTVDELYQEMIRAVVPSAYEVIVPPGTEGAPVEWRLHLSRDATLKPPAVEEERNIRTELVRPPRPPQP